MATKWQYLQTAAFFFAMIFVIQVHLNKLECQVKSSPLYLYSAFNKTNCFKATAQYQNKCIKISENSVSLM